MPTKGTSDVHLLFVVLACLAPILLTFSEEALVSASALPRDNISNNDDVLKERLRVDEEKIKTLERQFKQLPAALPTVMVVIHKPKEENEEEETPPKIERYPGEEEKNHTTIHWIVGDPRRKLQCTAKGTPKIKWQWVKLGVVEQKLTAAREDERIGLTELEFLKVDYGTEGYYKCIAKNDEGSDFRMYHVIVDKEGPSLVTIAIATISALAIVVLTGFLIYLKIKNHRYKQEIHDKYISEEDINDFKYGAKNTRGNLYADVAALSNELIEAQPYDAQFEIPRNKIFIYEHLVLGSGEYGIVIQGAVHNPRQGNLLKVAVKTLKSEAELLYFKALLSELKIMAFIGKHANVVNLVGACTENLRRRELFVAVEFCHFGNLKDFLTRNRVAFVDSNANGEGSEVVPRKPLTFSVSSDSLDPQAQFDNTKPQAFSQQDLIKWSYEIAKGMEFLASKKVVHADLAARNILLTKCLIAKISDFGLSKQLMNYTNYVKKQQCPLPWRWMSIESLQDYSFSMKSDVWSYGVCLWEIFSLGQIPYPGQVWSPDFLKQLCDGLRLGQPTHASDSLYTDIISPCWKADPGERPDFFQLKQRLESVLYSMSDQEYMDVLNSKYDEIIENCITQLYSEIKPEPTITNGKVAGMGS